jgi:hypothetical protein
MTDFFFFFFNNTGHWPVSDFKRICPPILLWIVRYFDVLWVYNLVISLGECPGITQLFSEGKKELGKDRKTAGRERSRGQGAQDSCYRLLLNKQYADPGKARFQYEEGYFSHTQNPM